MLLPPPHEGALRPRGVLMVSVAAGACRGWVRRLWSAALPFAAVLLVLWPVSADAAAGSVDPRERLREVERRTSELDREERDLQSRVDEAERQLHVLGERFDDASRRLESAREQEAAAVRTAEDASRRVERTGDEIVRAKEDLEEVERQLAMLARRAYVHGRSSVDPMLAAVAAAETQERLADRLHFLERTVGAQAASFEAAATLTVQLAALRERARAEAELAAEAIREAERATVAAAETHADVLALTEEASRAVAGQQERLEVIGTERRQLAAQADQLAARAEAEEAARAAAARSTSAAGGAPPGGLTTVRGITVATDLAPALEALLAAAAADGIVLGGSGYRSPEVTARLRIANGCPDIYNSPASACRVPTARPGSSEHERGLAVDFTYRGQTICYPRPSSRCSGNAAFDWLRANAARFGFHNLPAEAWHWSTTGR